MIENESAPSNHDGPCADEPLRFIGLIFTGGIGDVLLSLSALQWLNMAHPGSIFQAAYCHPEPQSSIAMEVKRLIAAQPRIRESRCSVNPESAIHSWGSLCTRTYNLSPCHFFTSFFRHAYPNLSFTLPADCDGTVKNLMSILGNDYLIVHPFSGHSEYNWKATDWDRLIALNYRSLPWVILGGPNEPSLRPKVTDLRGKLSLCQTLAVAQASRGAVVARSFVGIATTNFGIPTVTLTPAVKLHEMTPYYPPLCASTAPTFSFATLSSAPENVLKALSVLDARKRGTVA